MTRAIRTGSGLLVIHPENANEERAKIHPLKPSEKGVIT
jgi:hypothetical protein